MAQYCILGQIVEDKKTGWSVRIDRNLLGSWRDVGTTFCFDKSLYPANAKIGDSVVAFWDGDANPGEWYCGVLPNEKVVLPPTKAGYALGQKVYYLGLYDKFWSYYQGTVIQSNSEFTLLARGWPRGNVVYMGGEALLVPTSDIRTTWEEAGKEVERRSGRII